jgi:prephenate dehydratase
VLVARPGVRVDQITVLRSHPQALGQCRRFIERCLPNVTTMAALSTSGAVTEALADEYGAALASLRAAELNPVEILARDIQDRDTNETRFVVIGMDDAAPTGDDKTSLCFSVEKNRPGALIEVLKFLADAGINMTKVESRPAGDQLGQYIFLVDLEGHRDEPRVAEVLGRKKQASDLFKIFGSYPRWRGTA